MRESATNYGYFTFMCGLKVIEIWQQLPIIVSDIELNL